MSLLFIISRVLFNGKLKAHAMKAQTLNFPDGIIGHMPLLVASSIHDSKLAENSDINGLLRALQVHLPIQQQGTAYADKGYIDWSHIHCAYKKQRGPLGGLLQWHLNENECLKVMRGMVSEMPYGKLKAQNKFLDFSKNLKVNACAVSKIFTVAALLTNAHTCLYGSVVANHFNCFPPTLGEYFDCEHLIDI